MEDQNYTWVRFVDQYPEAGKKIVARHLSEKIIGEEHFFNLEDPNTRRAYLPSFEWSYVEEKKLID